MIKSNKSTWAKIIFHAYIMRLMKRHFHEFHLFGELPKLNSDAPVLLLPNHSTWWDGFFVYLLNEKILKRDLYLMMLDEQLKKYKFFARIGAFGITPGDKTKVRESLKYTVELLNKKNALVCIFPQGELLPWATRPLNFRRGVESIIRLFGKQVNLLPVAIHAEYGNEQRADVFFQFGENTLSETGKSVGIKWLEQKEEKLLAELNQRIVSREKGKSLLKGQFSVNEKVDKIFRK